MDVDFWCNSAIGHLFQVALLQESATTSELATLHAENGTLILTNGTNLNQQAVVFLFCRDLAILMRGLASPYAKQITPNSIL